MKLEPFDMTSAAHIAAAARVWNAALPPDLSISERFVRYNTLPSRGASQAGRLAVQTGRVVGFALATEFSLGDPVVSARASGWVDAIAVHPESQRKGVGRALLAWAEEWLASHGCTRYRLGGSLRPFAPGLPSGLAWEQFFRERGYDGRAQDGQVWDMARGLRDYVSPPSVRPGLPIETRPAQQGDEEALLAFLQREFPGRWRYEYEEHLRDGARISDYMLLLTDRGVDGFCQLTFEDSLRPLDRYYMHHLSRPWGQLGPIGVSAACRGLGYGAAILDAGLRRLRDAGVDGCVIDWTGHLVFYGKFGFRPFRQYEMLAKGAI